MRAVAAIRRWFGLLPRETTLPDGAEILGAYRDTMLWRTRIGAFAAALVIPATIFWFVLDDDFPLPIALAVVLAAELGIALVLLAGTLPYFRERFHLPFFFLVGVVCCGTEAAMVQLTGGATRSRFLFPYFVILFGTAALFPTRRGWAIATTAMAPVSFAVGELIRWGTIPPGLAHRDLLLLVDCAFIAVVGNRLVTRTFFSELEQRHALQVAVAQLRQLDQAKRDFFANLSHDLRTPLNIIIGPVQSALRHGEGMDVRTRRHLEMALRGARRLDGMINDMLDLARIEAGVGALSYVRVDLRALLLGLVETTSAYAASVGQKIEFISSSSDVVAEVDPEKVERVVSNLLSNALKFSSPGMRIQLKLEGLAEVVRITVQDEGPGIAPDEQARIFSRFVRSSDQSRKVPGVGIGLAVVKEFVDLHLGTVGVESQLGEGSKFTVLLPRKAPVGARVERAKPLTEAAAAAAARAEAERPPHEPKPSAARSELPRLLLVEDDDEARLFLSTELGTDAEVVQAPDGETALRLAPDRPDAILVDVNLPGIDGIETCRRLRRHPATAQVPIIVYSARGDLSTRARALEAGADLFMHKPLAPLDLRNSVYDLLRQRQVQAQ